jgi:hypothetical protein
MTLPKLLIFVVALTAAAFGQGVSPFIGSAWCGNVTSSTATVSIRMETAGQRVRLQISTNPSLTAATFSPAVTSAVTAGNTVKLSMQGLQPDTEYFYGIEVAGVLRSEPESRGRFRTFPLGRGSIRIAFSGDSDFRWADQRAFDAILAERPHLFVHLGDLHYIDTNTTNIDDYRRNYDAVLSQPNHAALFRNVPIAYTWGDHDYCGDNSNGTSIGRDTVRAAYRERVPHYPIASAGSTLAQSFTIGRVRVIMTDNRSGSVAASTRESSSKTRLGTAQKTWFKQELINARDSGFPLILWVNADPWIGPANVGDDTWAGYATERTELANFIRDNRVNNVVMLSADMHALAYDNGANSDYATGGGAPLTVLHAAALSQSGSVKGGPYAAGPLPGTNQYGILEIYDNGGPSVACRFLGMKVGEGVKMAHIFSSSAAGTKDHALVNISTLARINGPDDSVISGFVISSSSARNVLVRAVGPTLSSFGVSEALPEPVLSVYQGEKLINSNAGWTTSTRSVGELSDAFDRAGAFRLSSEDSRDSAMVLSLEPGAYTVEVKSGNGRPGSALLEVYDLP